MVLHGLSPVYEYKPESEIGVDIISIPGLPDLHPQYRLENHQGWLKNDLSHQVPRSRILQFQYNFAKNWSKKNKADWNDLEPIALQLLGHLSKYRSNASGRPIIFICYSFGAFILKQALKVATRNDAYSTILESTKGVLFIGCLNRADLQDFENRVLACAAIELKVDWGSDIIKCLKSSQKWDTIVDIVESFKSLTKRFPVRSFFEQQKTTYDTKPFAKLFKQKDTNAYLCCEDASRLDWGDTEKLLPVEADHKELLRIPSRTDDFFDVLVRNITELANTICPVPQVTQAINSPDLGLSSLPSGGGIGNQPRTSEDPTLVAQLPCHVTTPHQKPNETFVGRKNTLNKLEDILIPKENEAQRARVFALCGLGGMGKTQIGVSFVFKNLAKFRAVLWAHADSRAKLAESFSLFAVKLGLQKEGGPPQKLQADAKQLVKDWLRTTSESALVIFDNADSEDNREILEEFWPKGSNASILITSRDSRLLGKYEGSELKKMNAADAVELLKNLIKLRTSRGSSQAAAKNEPEVAEKLVKRLGCYPLGIRQAANLIAEDNWKFSDFYKALSAPDQLESMLFGQGGNSKFVDSSEAEYRYSLATVWNMNWTRLAEDEKNLMYLMSFLDPDRVQMELLRPKDDDPEIMHSEASLAFIGTEPRLVLAKKKLLHSSLISENPETDDIIMHRLVQAFCQLKMGAEKRSHFFGLSVMLVNQRWETPPPHETHNPKYWKLHRGYLPHAQSLCQAYVDALKTRAPLILKGVVNWDFPNLLYVAGWFCYESGLLASVADLLKPAEKYCLQHSEQGGARLLATIYGGLGSVDTETNRFRGAFEYFDKEWDQIKKAIASGGMKRPDILEIFGLGRLGNGHHGLQEYSKAEEYYRKCLKEWDSQKIAGDQKIFRTHLATCLWLQGRLSEAEEAVKPFTQDWEDRSNFRTGQALFSLGNIQTAQAQELLSKANACENDDEREATSLRAENRFEEAQKTHKQSWVLYHDILGKNHHKTADAHYKVGWHHHRRREYQAALKEFKAAMSVYNEHPDFFKNEIARTNFKMGTVCQDMGDLVTGRSLIDQAQKLRKDLIPPEKWRQGETEGDFDELVQFWTR